MGSFPKTKIDPREHLKVRIFDQYHVNLALRTVSFKFHLIPVHMCAWFMKTQGVKLPWDLHWGNKTYKLERSIGFACISDLISRTFCYCLRFSAERTSKLEEEVQPPSTDKRANSRKRIMSVIDGIPYRKVYLTNGKQLFTLHQTRTRRLIILTGHFVYTESVKIFALFTQNWWSRLNINFLI